MGYDSSSWAFALAVVLWQATPVDNAMLFVGADQILEPAFAPLLADRNIGVISNPTGVTRNLTHLVDLLHVHAESTGNFELRCVFGPEHGFRGDEQAGQGGSFVIDGRTGLKVYSAYSQSVQQLASLITATGIDTLVFDIQDVGVRFYTFIWTMFDMMRAAAIAPQGIRFVASLIALRFGTTTKPTL